MATVMRTEPMNASNAGFLRGDPITGDRYYSKECAQRKWDHMGTKIWHVAGREADIPEAGDWLTHHFGREPVIAVRQPDGGVRAFYNSCQHRGNRLVGRPGRRRTVAGSGCRWTPTFCRPFSPCQAPGL